MSKQSRAQRKQETLARVHRGEDPFLAVIEQMAQRADSLVNELTGLGTSADKRTATKWRHSSNTNDHALIDTVIVDDDMLHNVTWIPAEEMTREWVDLRGERADEVERMLEAAGAQQAFTEALAWERAYGGAVIMIGVDGQDTTTTGASVDVDYTTPLKMGGTLQWLTVFDRHEISRVMLDKNGSPEFYEIMMHSGSTRRVHHTRILRFQGEPMPRRRRATANGWGQSVIARVIDRVRDLNVGTEGIASALQDFDVSVMKLEHLTASLAADKSGVTRKRLAMLNGMKSLFRMLILDNKDNFENVSRNFAGVPDLLDRIAERVASAARMPVSLLMGRSPAGLNATGDSDIRWFYAHIRAQQNVKMRGPLRRLVEICSEALSIPEASRSTIEFRPLWEPTESERATTNLAQAQADQIYVGMGDVSAEDITRSRFGRTGFSVETQIDWDARDAAQATAADAAKAGSDALNADDSDIGPDGLPIAPGGAGTADIAKTVMNGAQVAAAMSIVSDVANGKIPRASGVALLELAFQLATADAERIMGTAGQGFVPTLPGGAVPTA